MTNRERFIRCSLGQSTDRGVFWEDRLWSETRARWRSEGMTENFEFGYDFYESESHSALNVDYGYLPRFEEKVLEDLGNKLHIIDQYGVEKLVMKDNPGLQHFLKYPVENRRDWEKLSARLDADNPGRFGEGWIEKAKNTEASGSAPLTLGGGHLCGFFSFLRETMGDNCYYHIYDEPELIRDMLQFQEDRICKMIMKTTEHVKIDRLFIWEDMCYKTGPLIGPEMFGELLTPHYSRLIKTAKNCGVKVIDVDSDGMIDSLIPLWLEAGVNMIHPFEVQAGMDVSAVRKTFGGNFAMRGGVDKRALAREKKDIDAEIERIRPAYEQGRYIPCADHSVPPDVPFYNYQYYIEKLKKMIGL